jgi:hypothetical protein
VSILVFNEGFYHVTLNCLISMVKIARLDNLVIAAAGPGSVARCRQLRLPCLDAVHLTRAHGGAAADGDAARGTAEWYQLVWVRTLAAHAAIARGYDVLFADADTVFLREALPVYRAFLKDNNAGAPRSRRAAAALHCMARPFAGRRRTRPPHGLVPGETRGERSAGFGPRTHHMPPTKPRLPPKHVAF